MRYGLTEGFLIEEDKLSPLRNRASIGSMMGRLTLTLSVRKGKVFMSQMSANFLFLIMGGSIANVDRAADKDPAGSFVISFIARLQGLYQTVIHAARVCLEDSRDITDTHRASAVQEMTSEAYVGEQNVIVFHGKFTAV